MSSLKLMEALREAIVKEKQQHKRFYVLSCGGQHYIKIPKHIIGHAMHVKELTGHHEGMSYL